MAKGKQSLKDTLDESKLIITDEEVGDIPFWLIDENYGVSADKYGYSLVEKKEMTRAIKDETGNVTGGEIYYAWQFCKSVGSFEDALLVYSKVTERNLMRKLVKCQDFRELVSIRLLIQKKINNSFKINGINADLLEACNSVQGHEELKLKLKEVNDLASVVNKTFNDFIEEIKEKRKIIVHEMPKEKKHRIKLEEN